MGAKQDWATRHLDKWERVKAMGIPGLQFIHVDSKHFSIRVSLAHLEEELTIGRPKTFSVKTPSQGDVDRAVKAGLQAPQAKVIEHPEIELEDSDIDRVLECWKLGQSAAGLFSVSVIPRAVEERKGGGYAAM